MFGLSLKDFKQKPSFWNGVAVVADGASLLLPIPAVVGGLKHADDAAKFLNGANDARRAGNGYQLSRSQQRLLNNIDRHGSYEKHVIRQREYGTLFENKDQWREYVGSVIAKPSESFKSPGKDLYWDDRLGTIVIDNKTGGPPTSFRPEQGKQYYLDRVAEQKSLMKKK